MQYIEQNIQKNTLLDKVLIEWCNKNLKPNKQPYLNGRPHHNLKEEIDGVLKYQDSTGVSGYYSGFDVYEKSDKTYIVCSCDDYCDNSYRHPVVYTKIDNIKELVMFLAFHGLDFDATLSASLQMLTGHVNLRDLHEIDYKDYFNNVKYMTYDDMEKIEMKYKQMFDKDYLIKHLNLDLTKCKELNGYYFPDLTKCDDIDEKLIEFIRIQMDKEYLRV